jgi:hypothetical protein
MKGLQLLESHPASAEVVRTWFLNQMIESFKDDTVPDGFKQYMREQGIDNDKMGTLIDVNPRNLFDVFDENDIIIETSLYPNGEFTIKIGNQATTNSWKTRKEAELFAIDAAFDILESKLTPKEETNETDNE